MCHEWISVRDKLPEDGQFVLISVDPERATHIRCGDKRALVFAVCFERAEVQGNNLVPYIWQCFGPGVLFGQSVTHWMPLPEPYKVPSLVNS